MNLDPTNDLDLNLNPNPTLVVTLAIRWTTMPTTTVGFTFGFRSMTTVGVNDQDKVKIDVRHSFTPSSTRLIRTSSTADSSSEKALASDAPARPMRGMSQRLPATLVATTSET